MSAFGADRRIADTPLLPLVTHSGPCDGFRYPACFVLKCTRSDWSLSTYRYSSASLRLMLASCANRKSAKPRRNVEITKSNPAP